MQEREFYRYRLYESTKKAQKDLKQTILATIDQLKDEIEVILEKQALKHQDTTTESLYQWIHRKTDQH